MWLRELGEWCFGVCVFVCVCVCVWCVCVEGGRFVSLKMENS